MTQFVLTVSVYPPIRSFSMKYPVTIVLATVHKLYCSMFMGNLIFSIILVNKSVNKPKGQRENTGSVAMG